MTIIVFMMNNKQSIEYFLNIFYLILQWYFTLMLFMKIIPTVSIYNIHSQLGQLQTLIVLYIITHKNDFYTAYTFAISYYIFDLIQMVVLQYRRNINENIIFSFHHLICMYVMYMNEELYYPLVYRLELSNLSLIAYYHFKHVTAYKRYINIMIFCWYTYFRVFSLVPYYSLTYQLTSFMYTIWFVFYVMGIYWSFKLLRQCC